MENLKYRVIYEYEFYRGTSAAETARRINDVYGAATVKENTVRHLFTMVEPRRTSQILSQTKVDSEKSTGECLVD